MNISLILMHCFLLKKKECLLLWFNSSQSKLLIMEQCTTVTWWYSQCSDAFIVCLKSLYSTRFSFGKRTVCRTMPGTGSPLSSYTISVCLVGRLVWFLCCFFSKYGRMYVEIQNYSKDIRILCCQTKTWNKNQNMESEDPQQCSGMGVLLLGVRMQSRSIILFLQGSFHSKMALYCESMRARN